jgi:hypothetical protein
MAVSGDPALADPQISWLPNSRPLRESAHGMALATSAERNSGQRGVWLRFGRRDKHSAFA